MNRWIIVGLVVVLAGGAAGGAWWWRQQAQPLAVAQVPLTPQLSLREAPQTPIWEPPALDPAEILKAYRQPAKSEVAPATAAVSSATAAGGPDRKALEHLRNTLDRLRYRSYTELGEPVGQFQDKVDGRYLSTKPGETLYSLTVISLDSQKAVFGYLGEQMELPLTPEEPRPSAKGAMAPPGQPMPQPQSADETQRRMDQYNQQYAAPMMTQAAQYTPKPGEIMPVPPGANQQQAAQEHLQSVLPTYAALGQQYTPPPGQDISPVDVPQNQATVVARLKEYQARFGTVPSGDQQRQVMPTPPPSGAHYWPEAPTPLPGVIDLSRPQPPADYYLPPTAPPAAPTLPPPPPPPPPAQSGEND